MSKWTTWSRFVMVAAAAMMVPVLVCGCPTTQTEMQTQTQTQNIMQFVQATPSLSTLSQMLQSTGLDQTLRDPSATYTLFAPTNNAFNALIPGELTSLQDPANAAQLEQILRSHIVNGQVFTGQLTNGRVLTAINGDALEVLVQNGVIYVGGVPMVQSDIQASNGVVQVLGGVILPAGM